MAKYHINSKGEAGLCRARRDSCPFGSLDEHYSSREEAQTAFEKSQHSFSKTMSHEPRANWRSLTPVEEQRIATNYRRALRSIRSTPTQASAAATKQQALVIAAEQYRVPVSQVKSIVQLSQEEAGAPTVHTDPVHLEQLAYHEATRKLIATARTNGDGQVLCACGSAKSVKVRTNPFLAEIEDRAEPMLCCIDCYNRAAEDI